VITNISKNKGILLIDIMIALSLSLLFIVAITESSLIGRKVFDGAKNRNDLLDAFSGIVSTTTIDIVSFSRPFGNDRIEIITKIKSFYDEVTFHEVISSNSTINASTPICSPFFANKNVIGNYQYIKEFDSNNIADVDSIEIKQITLPIDPLLLLTDIEVRNNIAYVSTDSARASDPDILIFDIHEVQNPILLSSVNTGPGIASVSIFGNKIYGSASSRIGQLHIIKLNSPNDISLINKFRLPLPYATATAPLGSSVFYDNNFVYLGTDKWDGSELSIIDIDDPMNPEVVGNFETGSKINDIFVHNNIAYIVASDQNQLRTIHVFDHSNPLLISSFSPTGWQRQEGKSISIFEDGLSLGRTPGGFNIIQDHEIFHWASTSNGVLNNMTSKDISGGVYGIVLDKNNIYFITRTIDKELIIGNNDLSSLEYKYYSLPIAPKTITCDSDRLYILANSAPIIYEITF
jgi:hypothetical protein